MSGVLCDRVVVVTGASAGIGRAVVDLFAEHGSTVVMLARGKERLEEAAAEIGPLAFPIATDISNPDSVDAAFNQIDKQFGKIDALLNIAGIARITLIEDASNDDIACVTGTNFLGPIYTTRAAIPLLRKAGGGDIINISTEATLDDLPLMTLYSCTKNGLEGFTRTMTKELKQEGIRVSLVVMGSTESSFGENFSPEGLAQAGPVWEADGYFERVAGKVPMNPENVAEVMLFVVTRPRELMMDVLHVRAFS